VHELPVELEEVHGRFLRKMNEDSPLRSRPARTAATGAQLAMKCVAAARLVMAAAP